MGEVKHTSGEWRAVDGEIRSDLGGIAQAYWSSGQAPGEYEANLLLMAAAPDLLEAGQAFIPTNLNLDNPNVPDDLVVPLDVTMGELRALRAALSKAKGQDNG